MVLQAEEINVFNDMLERGDKKRLAQALQVDPDTISRYFRYNKKHGGWLWPRDKYKKALEFINSL